MLAEDDPRHGTLNGYSNLRCRCEPCRAAWAEYTRNRNHETGRTSPRGERRHGTRSMYTRGGCRCEPCSDANRTYQREYMREWSKRKSGRGA